MCIGQSKSERVKHFVFCCCFKITVSHVDVFRIKIPVLIAKAGGGRVIFYGTGDSIAQTAAGVYPAGQHVGNAAAALHSALPYIKNSGGLTGLHPFHINDIPHIQKYRRPGKMSAYRTDHGLLFFRKQVASRFSLGILILSGGPSDDNQRHVAYLSGSFCHIVRQRHFFLGPWLLSPALSLIKRVPFAPFFVDCRQLFVDVYLLFLAQRIQDSCHIAGIYKPA